MSNVSSVPKPVFGAGGFAAPAEPDILTGVLTDINAAFGNRLTTRLASPQGQLASTEAAVIADKDNQFLWFVSQVDPATSTGRMQDAIARIYFIARKAATATTAACTLTGKPGAIVQAGTLAINSADNTLYRNLNTVTIDTGGSATTSFAAVTTGPLVCGAHSLRVYQSVPGWDTIDNTDGIVGTDVEDATDFEIRRNASVGQNGQGTVAALRGAVLSVPDVIDAFVTDNPTGSPVSLGVTAIALPAHSVYIAVAGGGDVEVAKAIWSRLNPGPTMVGNTTVTVPDTSYLPPYPTYAIAFERPAALPIKVLVQLDNNSQVPSNVLAIVQSDISWNFVHGSGAGRARIGSEVYASALYPYIQYHPWVRIRHISVALVGSSSWVDGVTVGFDQIATLDPSQIAVTLF